MKNTTWEEFNKLLLKIDKVNFQNDGDWESWKTEMKNWFDNELERERKEAIEECINSFHCHCASREESLCENCLIKLSIQKHLLK